MNLSVKIFISLVLSVIVGLIAGEAGLPFIEKGCRCDTLLLWEWHLALIVELIGVPEFSGLPLRARNY